MNPSYATLLKTALRNGTKKGWSGFLWMIKIVVPVSFLTTLLAWSGWLNKIEFIIQPVMGVLSLPAQAALPLLIGILTGIYGGIAAMVVLPFSAGEMTLMAVFLLMAHNMIQEGIVQGKSGIHPVKATLFRLSAATLTVIIVAPWLAVPSPSSITAAPLTFVRTPLFDMLLQWLDVALGLCLKIFVIIMILLTFLEIMKIFNWIVPIVRFMSPLLKIMGLDRNVGFLWMTAILFGLTYGGAVIVEEAKERGLSKKDLEMLHLSVGINHSLIEDPPLFIVLGLNAFWLYIPRLITAILTVHLIRLWQEFAKRYINR
ncbi:MAG: iron transporter [Deltaproteobacteria bacterium]|nr:iron transporter [Deltaproteobacteria bacterium]